LSSDCSISGWVVVQAVKVAIATDAARRIVVSFFMV